MAKALFFSLFMFISHVCIAQIDLPQQQFWETLRQQQQHRLRAKTRCNVQQLTARQPSYTYNSEAGRVEIWDASHEEFECAGIEFIRHVIQPKGLLVPYYTNAPQLSYIVEGSGIHGAVIPGCAETFESESERSSEGEGGRRRNDRHQKIERIRRGDVLALKEGITHWVYNDGDTPLTCVEIVDVANDRNQLDLKFRKFFLAGNPESSEGEGEYRRRREQGGESMRKEEQQQSHNIFHGFDEELLAQTFNVDPELIRRLKGRDDQRGVIVRAERLRLVFPEYGREEQEQRERRGRGEYSNGIEETICSLKMRQNIDDPARADVYNPRGGRITTVNSQTLPILSQLRLSAERGVLYRNAIVAPHYSINSHCALYVTRGSARIQVVGNRGESVFNEEVNQGQLLVVPQNFVVMKKANSDEGFEYITFKTNDNAINQHLAGRLSALRAMPDEVLVNAYGISRDEARNLKYGREETTLLSPRSRSA